MGPRVVGVRSGGIFCCSKTMLYGIIVQQSYRNFMITRLYICSPIVPQLLQLENHYTKAEFDITLQTQSAPHRPGAPPSSLRWP